MTIIVIGDVLFYADTTAGFKKIHGAAKRQENYAVVNRMDKDGETWGYRLKDQFIHTIAHEIAHVIVDEFHPDEDAGIAPLLGTDRTQRILCSGLNLSLNSKLLVKTEWDAAEEWLKANVDTANP